MALVLALSLSLERPHTRPLALIWPKLLRPFPHHLANGKKPQAHQSNKRLFRYLRLSCWCCLRENEPEAAMMSADERLLELFCLFLELRVQTQSLTLLRRMMHEFLHGQEQTLQDFLLTSAAMVAILPFELDAQDPRRLKAQQLLLHPKTHSYSSPHGCVFLFLLARVATRHITMLKQIFNEFCAGHEATLLKFVKDGTYVISVLPYEMPRQMETPLAAPSASTAPHSIDTPQHKHRHATPTHAKAIAINSKDPHPAKALSHRPPNASPVASKADTVHARRPRGRPRKKPRSEDIVPPTAAEPEPPAPSVTRRAPRAMDDATREMKLAVGIRMLQYEASEPWKKVFADLPLPFDEQKHQLLGIKLRRFWERYGRAVWERNFWRPIMESMDREPYTERKARQRNALMAFEAITRMAYESLGAAFFVRLDKVRHPGWWYRNSILDIYSFYELEGADACWSFVEAQLTCRFPESGMTLPLKSANYGVLKAPHTGSASMWITSMADFTVPAIAEIEALKAEHEPKAEREA